MRYTPEKPDLDRLAIPQSHIFFSIPHDRSNSLPIHTNSFAKYDNPSQTIDK